MGEKRFEGRLEALPGFDGSRDELRDLLEHEALGLASLLSAALDTPDREEREAAHCLVSDLRALLQAAAAAIEGRPVTLREDDFSLDASERVVRMARVLAIDPPEACIFTAEALAARELIGRRLESEVRAMRAGDANARAEKRDARAAGARV